MEGLQLQSMRQKICHSFGNTPLRAAGCLPVVPELRLSGFFMQQILQGDAVEKIMYQPVKSCPHGERVALTAAGTRLRVRPQTVHG